MRVLFLTHNYPRYRGDHPGGFLHRLAKDLLARGTEISVLAPHYPGRPCFELIDGVRVYRFRYAPERLERIAYSGEMHKVVSGNPLNLMLFPCFILFFLFKAIELTLAEKPKVLAAQWWAPAGAVCCLVSFLTGKGYILTTHGTDVRLLSGSNLVRSIARPIFSRAVHVTAVSTFLKDRLLHHLSLGEQRVSVVPMPPDLEKFQVRDLPCNRGKVILNLSHFTAQKKLDVFVRACSKLKERGHQFKALCVGGGPLRGELERLISDLSLTEVVELREAVPFDEVASLYYSCDLCVLCSEAEGFGLSLVEAQLCGRPVIGTDSGGIPDIIQDGVNGLLVPVGDPESLAEAMARLLDDPELASKLASEGARSARQRFNPQVLAGHYDSILIQTAEG